MQNLILIVDEREEDQLSLEETLAATGVTNTTLTLSDGAEALRYLKGEAQYSDRKHYPFPSIIFLDLKLPQVSGWDLLRWIKGNSKKSSPKIFIHTESLPISEVRQVYAQKADSYLPKPITEIGIIGLIHQFTGPWELRPENEETS